MHMDSRGSCCTFQKGVQGHVFVRHLWSSDPCQGLDHDVQLRVFAEADHFFRLVAKDLRTDFAVLVQYQDDPWSRLGGSVVLEAYWRTVKSQTNQSARSILLNRSEGAVYLQWDGKVQGGWPGRGAWTHHPQEIPWLMSCFRTVSIWYGVYPWYGV